MLTSEQMRAARALLRMEQTELATRSGVSVETIKRMESTNGAVKGREDTIRSVRRALEQSGIEFIEPDASVMHLQRDNLYLGSGVRLASDPTKKVAEEIIEAVKKAAQLSLTVAYQEDPQFFHKGASHIANEILKGMPPFIERGIDSAMSGTMFHYMVDVDGKVMKDSL